MTVASVEKAQLVVTATRSFVSPPGFESESARSFAADRVGRELTFDILFKLSAPKVVAIAEHKSSAEAGEVIDINIGTSACADTGRVLEVACSQESESGYRETVGKIEVIGAQKKVARARVIMLYDSKRPVQIGDLVALTDQWAK